MFKGYKFTEEHKRNISESKKGKKMSLEARTKMSKTKIGTKLTEKTRKIMSLKKLGKKHPNWKGGVTPINHQIRGSLEYRLWREAVFKRDNWTCIWCGIKSRTTKNSKGKWIILHADHIKPFAHYPELRFAIDNGRTLCIECHKTTDTYGGNSKILINQNNE